MPASSRVRRAGAAIGSVALAYAIVLAGLTALSVRAEATGRVYPYPGGNMPLRFLLPSLVGGSGDRTIMITGSSTAGDSLLYEEFERALPAYRTYPGTFPVATLDEILLMLDYLERTYGSDVLPDLLVVGVEPRLLANKPRRFGAHQDDPIEFRGAFLVEVIDKYSSTFRVARTSAGSRLVQKGRLEGVAASWRFWTQTQQPRHRAAIAALLDRVLNGPGLHMDLASGITGLDDVRNPFDPETIRTALQDIANDGLYMSFRQWLPAYISPYVFHYVYRKDENAHPRLAEAMFNWNPEPEADLIAANVIRLRQFAARTGMKLVVVNTPQRPSARAAYSASYYASLMRITRGALGDTPFLDLRELIERHEFIDEHVDRSGAEKTTARVIDFIKSQGVLER